MDFHERGQRVGESLLRESMQRKQIHIQNKSTYSSPDQVPLLLLRGKSLNMINLPPGDGPASLRNGDF